MFHSGHCWVAVGVISLSAALSLLSKQELLLFQLEITEELARVLPLTFNFATYACIISTFDCNYVFLLSTSLFSLSQGLRSGTEGKQGSQRGLQWTPVSCK